VVAISVLYWGVRQAGRKFATEHYPGCVVLPNQNNMLLIRQVTRQG
jgi:hypothetical protein